MARKKQNKVVIFEEIKNTNYWIIFVYRILGYEIYFLRSNRLITNRKWFKKCLQKKFIERIEIGLQNIPFSGFYSDKAYDNVELVYRHISDNSLIIKKVISLFRNKNIELGYKKNINQGLSRFYYINHILNILSKDFSFQKITFIPSNGIEVYRTDNCEIYDYFKFYKWAKAINANLFNTNNIKFPIWTVVFSYISAGKRKLKICLQLLGFFFWVCLIRIRDFVKYSDSSESNYKYAIMVINPLRQLANKIQKVDFLVDNEIIKKKDVIFLSCKKLNKKSRNYMESNKLNYLDDVDKFISWEEIRNILPAYFLLLTSFLKEDSLVLGTGLKVIYFYLRWKSFAKNIRIKNLVTHCDMGIQSIARNIIFEQYNCKTYHYMDSTNFGCFFIKKGNSYKYRNNFFSFLYYDYFIAWNDMVSGLFKASQCNIRNYLNLGCFWAEHLREIKIGKIKLGFKDKLYKKGYNQQMKLISVFDTTFHDDGITTYDDGIKFLQGILKLLEGLPNIFIVLKEKKSRTYHQKITDRFKDILRFYIELEKHPRCYLPGRKESPSEIMAFSDLTISFPFTSTTFEALSARKKAIWYDAADKFRDTFYDRIPGLVCHNYEELLKRTKELLNIDDSEYNNYLETNVKGKIENYLDGKAITRFRELLANNKNTTSGSKVSRFDLIGKKK